jgi:hypothetical protein
LERYHAMSGLEVTGVSRLPMKGSPLMGCTTWYVGCRCKNNDERRQIVNYCF